MFLLEEFSGDEGEIAVERRKQGTLRTGPWSS